VIMDAPGEEVVQQLRREFIAARKSLHAGNEGMVRVCARRAAGIAIRHWMRNGGRSNVNVDAMSLLRNLLQEPLMPPAVLAAATRLSARIDQQFSSPSIDPLHDCRIIIEHLLGSETADRLT
jgi:hypothetical protein